MVSFSSLQVDANTTQNTENGLADLACMLLSNLAKADSIKSLISMTRTTSIPDCPSSLAMDQLLDVYVRGHGKTLNPHANYDFLTNLFSDLTRFPEGRNYFSTVQAYDGIIPLSKIVVFTDSSSLVRRTGVASVIKNCCFDTSKHATLLDEAGLNLLLYLLTPLCGPDSENGQDSVFKENEVEGLFDSLQFLPDDKKREPDPFTLTIHLDSLLLLCSTRAGREHLRRRETYAIIRQLHLIYGDTNEEVAECCDKLVNMLIRDEDPEDCHDLDPLNLHTTEDEETDDEMGIEEV